MSLQSREDAFLSSKTSSRKSICYQDFPALLYMCLYNTVCNVIVIVIEPLVVILSKQMNLLQDTGYRSTYFGRNDFDNENIKHGNFIFLFSSPGNILTSAESRCMQHNDIYQNAII